MNIEIMCFIWFACTSVNNNTCLKLRYVVSSLALIRFTALYVSHIHVNTMTEPSSSISTIKEMHWNKYREEKKKNHTHNKCKNDMHKKCVYLRFQYFFFPFSIALWLILVDFVSFRSWFTFWLKSSCFKSVMFFFFLFSYLWWTMCYSYWPLVNFWFWWWDRINESRLTNVLSFLTLNCFDQNWHVRPVNICLGDLKWYWLSQIRHPWDTQFFFSYKFLF